MSDAAFTAIASITVAMIGVMGVMLGHLYKRQTRLERDHQRLGEENRHLWLWARAVVDYSYRWRRPNSPEIPTLEDTISKDRREQPRHRERRERRRAHP